MEIPPYKGPNITSHILIGYIILRTSAGRISIVIGYKILLPAVEEMVRGLKIDEILFEMKFIPEGFAKEDHRKNLGLDTGITI